MIIYIQESDKGYFKVLCDYLDFVLYSIRHHFARCIITIESISKLLKEI